MIKSNGWDIYSSWENSSTVRDLYKERCRLEAPEMTCHAQAADILKSHIVDGDSVLDVGCGSGYFFHSIASRKIAAKYWGIDSSKSLIEIGRKERHGVRDGRCGRRRHCSCSWPAFLSQVSVAHC